MSIRLIHSQPLPGDPAQIDHAKVETLLHGLYHRLSGREPAIYLRPLEVVACETGYRLQFNHASDQYTQLAFKALGAIEQQLGRESSPCFESIDFATMRDIYSTLTAMTSRRGTHRA